MKREFHLLSGLLMMALLVFSTALMGCSRTAVSAPVPAPAAVAAPAYAAGSTPGAPPQEGIKVHGHWTIEVTNPDGTLAKRREFDNALTPGGRVTLAMVLGRQHSVGGWGIHLRPDPAYAYSPFMDDSGSGSTGIIAESTNTLTYPYVFKNLTVGLTSSPSTLVLSGTARAQRSGRIETVSTRLVRLSPDLPPSATYGIDSFSLTEATLSEPVILTAGQQVAVTVVISFS